MMVYKKNRITALTGLLLVSFDIKIINCEIIYGSMPRGWRLLCNYLNCS